MEDDSQADHMTLDFGVASTTRKGVNTDTASLGNMVTALQVCICGWREGNFTERLEDPPGIKRCLDEGVQGPRIEHYS